MISKKQIEEYGKQSMCPGWFAKVEETENNTLIVSCKSLPNKVRVKICQNISHIDDDIMEHTCPYDDGTALIKIWNHMQYNAEERKIYKEKLKEYAKKRNKK